MARAMTMVAIGIAIGALAAVPSSQWLRSLVFEVDVVDPFVYVVVAAGILGIAWLAAYLPARRAAGLDPLTTLREH